MWFRNSSNRNNKEPHMHLSPPFFFSVLFAQVFSSVLLANNTLTAPLRESRPDRAKRLIQLADPCPLRGPIARCHNLFHIEKRPTLVNLATTCFVHDHKHYNFQTSWWPFCWSEVIWKPFSLSVVIRHPFCLKLSTQTRTVAILSTFSNTSISHMATILSTQVIE